MQGLVCPPARFRILKGKGGKAQELGARGQRHATLQACLGGLCCDGNSRETSPCGPRAPLPRGVAHLFVGSRCSE